MSYTTIQSRQLTSFPPLCVSRVDPVLVKIRVTADSDCDIMSLVHIASRITNKVSGVSCKMIKIKAFRTRRDEGITLVCNFKKVNMVIFFSG